MVSDLYQTMNASGLWRGGPVENYAVAGIDMALWDIKAKRASMPLYELLGGKTRSVIHCYGDAGGTSGARDGRERAKGFGSRLHACTLELSRREGEPDAGH